MANLLPLEEKEKIYKEYKSRLSVIALFVLAGLLIVSIFFLAPGYLVSSLKFDISEKQLEVEQQKIEELAAGGDPKSIALEVNAKLIVLDVENTSTASPYELFGTLIGHKPSGVSINSLSYTNSGDGAMTITAFGVADERRSLLIFVESLESDEIFSKAELPISSFAPDSEINFSVKVFINKLALNNNEE